MNFNLFFQTILSGLISGAIYGVLGMGFVVTYKSTRVLNLAHGGMAMFLAFVTLSCLHRHWNYGLALGVTAVAAIAMGIAIDFSIMRPLRNRPPLDSAVASLGLLLTLQGLAVIIFGAQEKVFPAAVPLRFVKVAGFNFSYPQLLAFACVIVSAALVGIVFKWTRAGLAIRAYVENPDSARGLGVSPLYVSTIAWSLAALLAAVAGVMLAPLTLLDSLRMPLFSVKALVAALLGGLTSLSGALLGGLLLGVAEAYFQGYVHFRDSVNYLPFGLVVLALLYQGFQGYHRPDCEGSMNAKVGALLGAKQTRTIGAVVLAAGVAVIPLFGTHFTAFIFTLGVVYGLAAMSLSMLTGWVGQASLGHAAFAGAGAFATAKLQQHGWPFLAIMPVVVGAALIFSLVVGLPALRIRGLQLAVATLAFGYSAERGVFEQLGGGYSNDTVLHRPHAFGVNFLNDKNYYLLCLAIAVVLTALAANLRHRTMGRGMMAVRESETVFSHVGGNVASYKLAGFCISAVYAAIAGVLLGGLIANINKDLFNVQFGFYILAVAIVGGMGSLIGPYISGLAFAWYPQLFAGITALQYWTYMIGGLGMIVFVLVLPGGLVAIPERIGALTRWIMGRLAKGKGEDDGEEKEIDLTMSANILSEPSANGATAATKAKAREEARSYAAISLTEGQTTLSRRMRDRQEHKIGSSEPLLRIEDVSIAFGGTVALTDVSFEVHPREVHGLVGPNGAGKSTMFNCITGIYRPQQGTIIYKDQPLTKLPSYKRARLGIARTFQNINVLPNLSVLENLMVAEQAHWSGNLLRDALGLDAHHQQEMVRQKADATLEFLGLAHLRSSVAGDLSHGTLKLVELARALTSEPEMLLLDEPAAGLSMQESQRLGEVLQQLRDELNLTVLIVEHDMALVMGNCNRVTVLDYGRVIASGPPDAVRNDPAVIAAYLGTTHEEVLAR